MKSIHKIFALSLVMFLSINFATAQRDASSATPEAQAKKQTDRLVKDLSLDENQAAKINAINLDYATKRLAAKGNSTDKVAGKAAMKALRTEKAAAIESVLTAEQLEKYNKKAELKKAGKKGNGKAGKKGDAAKKEKGVKPANAKGGKDINPEKMAAKHTKRMTEQLGLSTDQVSQVSAINLAYATKLAEAKAASTDEVAIKATAKTLRTEKTEAIKAILTAEQLTKFASKAKGKRKKGAKKEN